MSMLSMSVTNHKLGLTVSPFTFDIHLSEPLDLVLDFLENATEHPLPPVVQDLAPSEESVQLKLAPRISRISASILFCVY